MRDPGWIFSGEQFGLTIRNLGAVRWIALSGQLVAILAVRFVMGYPLPLAACLALVAASALLGLLLAVVPVHRGRMGQRATFLLLCFDIVQLFLLLYLTGGLANPFSILFLAPVTVSAVLFRRRATAFLVALTVALQTVLAFHHMPLPWPGGLQLDSIYTLGLWTALVVATVFVAFYAGMVSSESRNMAQALAETRLALERERKMVSLGGLATSAAHKLGSPLNTITLIAHELERFSNRGSTKEDDSQYAEDIRQLKEEVDRCRRILAELNDEARLLGSEAAEPVALSAFVNNLMEERFADIAGMLRVEVDGDLETEPRIVRRAELIHPIENLVDNAAQFAESSVRIALSWTGDDFTIVIRDDGPGFQPGVLNQLGTPYSSSRKGEDGHMGLGVFIAMTMVANAGGSTHIGNLKAGGAEVVITYPRNGFAPSAETQSKNDNNKD